MIGIYKITNPLGEVYIGKSEVDIKERMSRYKYNYAIKNQPKIYDSIIKFGYTNHVFEIIETCNIEEINDREKFWIDYYDCINNGLNCTTGGNGGLLSEESKLKKSKSMTGRKASTETKLKMSKSKINHPMYNDSWRKKMKSSTWKGKAAKPILQFDKEGNFIKEWPSAAEVSRNIKGTYPANISSNANGRVKTHAGFIWKFK